MGPIESFLRLVVSLLLFVGVLIAGIVFAPQLTPLLGNLPGTLTVHNGNTTVVVPILPAIVGSVLLSVLVNLLFLPFRRRSAPPKTT